jgi:hypothetical protein
MEEPWTLQFNHRLFRLVVVRFYESYDRGDIQLCSSDYAGFWMEQLQKESHYHCLITHWFGSKNYHVIVAAWRSAPLLGCSRTELSSFVGRV